MHTFTADLNLLYEIVVVADASKQKGSFLAIFEAYDTVLRRKNIDSVNDRIYYKFLLKLVQIQGQGWKYKFKSLMKDMGIDFKSIAKTNIQNSVPVDRYGELNYLFTPDNEELSKSSKEFFYNSYETFDNSLNFQTRNSPAAIEFTQREQIRSPLYNDIEKNVKQAEYIYNERCIQIKQKYFRTWIQKTKYVYNGFQSMYFKAVMHDTYILSFQALGIWRQKSLYYEKIKNNAHNARNYIQMEKSFIKWIKAFYIKKKECRDLYNFILMRIFLNSWRKIWIMQYKVAALYRLSFSFSIWKKKLLIQKNSAFEATKWQRLHILKHIFVNWRTKTYLNRLKFNKELKKKHKVFLLWKWQLELIYRKKKSLIKSYSKKLINYYYKLWHQKLKQNQENMTKAITLSNNLNIIKTFQLWNIKYKTEVSKKLFLSFKNIFLCKKHFLNWKKKTENKQMASDFFNYLLLRSTFLYWRRKLHFNAFLIKLKNELKGKIIYKWILKERLTLLLRIKGRRLCYLIFYFWRKRYHTLNNKDLPLIFMLKNKINHRIKTITFLKWTEKLFLLRKNEKNAKTIIHINTKRNIINIWRKKNIIIQKNNTTAGYKNNYLYMKHTIVHWKKIFYKKTEAQKELQVNLFIYNHNFKLCHKVIMHWRYCLKSIILSHNIALKFRINKFEYLIIQFFNIWINKYKNLNTIFSRIQKERRLKQLKLYLIKWKTKQNIIFTMNNLISTILMKKYHTLIKKCFRKWELHILQLRGPEIQAHLFKKRQSILFMKTILYFWRQQFKKKLISKKQNKEKNTDFALPENLSNITSNNFTFLSPFLNKLQYTKF